jgi:hypothetical protein
MIGTQFIKQQIDEGHLLLRVIPLSPLKILKGNQSDFLFFVLLAGMFPHPTDGSLRIQSCQLDDGVTAGQGLSYHFGRLVRTIAFCVVGAITVLWIWKKLFD